ncbi:uncharacterized protein F4812DRAFT_425378 [Daldinia caldariorum]|uniref:uncharacterized protein n=1 Tax=Daldinia caldariorum TaxID=326644 RepID=UPI0020087A63|nr:uncharacterized protein F4812DRAFT_425378 [Daldinia caldariorum]KAI1468988.1 hypothetical protein F4812DRAFT_425378 [Daldinia caldariorum]
MYDSEDERIVAEIHRHIPENERVFRTKVGKDVSPTAKIRPKRPETPKRTDSVVTILERSPKDPDTLSDDELQERQIAHALSTTRTNLTRISQFILKLECRAGKITKEGIKQTLDATVANVTTNAADNYPTYQDELEEIQHLSESTWQRLYLIDRHWRRQSNLDKDAGAPNSHIELESEPGVKAFLKGERQSSHITSQDPCYYTAYNLVNGRRFEDWIAYLKDFCEFKENPTEETKLVHLAWRFLDRDLRGPRPGKAARLQDFLDSLNDQYDNGAFDEAIKNPRKMEQDDDGAWGAIKKFWFTRFQG